MDEKAAPAMISTAGGRNSVRCIWVGNFWEFPPGVGIDVNPTWEGSLRNGSCFRWVEKVSVPILTTDFTNTPCRTSARESFSFLPASATTQMERGIPKEGCKRAPVPTGIESWSGNRLFRKKGAEPPPTTLFMAGARQWRGRFFGVSGVERGAANRMGAAVFGGERAQKGRSDRAIYGQGGEFSWGEGSGYAIWGESVK